MDLVCYQVLQRIELPSRLHFPRTGSIILRMAGPDTLSPRYEAAYQMRTEGMSWEQIGGALGISKEAAQNYAALWRKQTGLPRPLRQARRMPPELPIGAAMSNPQKIKVPDDLDDDSDSRSLNGPKFMELAAQAGVPAKIANGLLERWNNKYARMGHADRIVKGKQLADELSGKLGRLIDYLDDYAMANMSGKDLTIAIGILAEKVLLLEGKPTQVYDVNVSHKIEILMPQFMAEAKRRGLTIDSVATRVTESSQ